MIYEIAELEIIEGQNAEFEAAVKTATEQFKNAEGCRSLILQRGIEAPNTYKLVVGWNTVDDHMVTFRESEGFQIWRRLAGPYFTKPPQVSHVETVLEGF